MRGVGAHGAAQLAGGEPPSRASEKPGLGVSYELTLWLSQGRCLPLKWAVFLGLVYALACQTRAECGVLSENFTPGMWLPGGCAGGRRGKQNPPPQGSLAEVEGPCPPIELDLPPPPGHVQPLL